GGHAQALDGGRRVHHLGGLLFQGHAGEQVLDALLERGVGILIERRGLAPQGRRQDKSRPKKVHDSLSPKNERCLQGVGCLPRAGQRAIIQSMMAKILVPACAAACMGLLPAAEFPSAEITNGQIRAKIYLPNAQSGYYRGTRFDWSGVVYSLQYKGHNYYGPWVQRTDP